MRARLAQFALVIEFLRNPVPAAIPITLAILLIVAFGSSAPVDSRPTPTRAHSPASSTVGWSRSRQQAQIQTRAPRS
jgi:hypothetical protein